MWWAMNVHRGFQWSWTNHHFNRRVVDWVAAYRRSNPQGRVIVTGGWVGGCARVCAWEGEGDIACHRPIAHPV